MYRFQQYDKEQLNHLKALDCRFDQLEHGDQIDIMDVWLFGQVEIKTPSSDSFSRITNNDIAGIYKDCKYRLAHSYKLC